MVIHDLDDLGDPDGLETSVYVFVYHCNLHLHNTAVYTPSAPSLLQVSIVIQKIQWLGGSQGIFSKKLWENAQDLFRKLGKTMGKASVSMVPFSIAFSSSKNCMSWRMPLQSRRGSCCEKNGWHLMTLQ